jgi:hypothetical protein
MVVVVLLLLGAWAVTDYYQDLRDPFAVCAPTQHSGIQCFKCLCYATSTLLMFCHGSCV